MRVSSQLTRVSRAAMGSMGAPEVGGMGGSLVGGGRGPQGEFAGGVRVVKVGLDTTFTW